MEPGDLVWILRVSQSLTANVLYSSCEKPSVEDGWINIDWGPNEKRQLAVFMGMNENPNYKGEYFAHLLWHDREAWIEMELVEKVCSGAASTQHA